MTSSTGFGRVTEQVPPPSRAKLLQQLAALREEVMYVIFLDLYKAYDALDRSICIKILEG